MSSYPPPTNWTQSIFNPQNWVSYNDALTLAMGNKKYLIKTGTDTAVGSITVKNPVQATVFKATQGTFPDAAFTNSTNLQTGLYFGTTTTCGIICNGVGKMTFGTSGTTSFQPIIIPDASAAAPSLTFSSVQNAGIYYGGANQVAVSSAGGRVIGIDTSGVKFYNSVSGYTPSGLNYYEENADLACTWTYGSVSVSAPIRLTRIGRQVFCQITTDLNFSANAFSAFNVGSTANIVPARFRPNNVCCFASAWSNRNSVYDNFLCFIELNGTINLWQRGYIGSNTTAYIWAFSGTWTVA